MNRIDVIPTKASAEALVHPVDGLLGKGASWRLDTFTARRLSDGSVTRGTPAEPAATAGEAEATSPAAAPSSASPSA